LKELFLKDLNVSKLNISNHSENNKTIYFEQIKIKYDDDNFVSLSPSIYTDIGFDKFVLEDNNMQVSINLDFNSHYLSMDIIENQKIINKNKIFQEKIKSSIEEQLKEQKYECINIPIPEIIKISKKGREMLFESLDLEDSKGNRYKINSKLIVPSDKFFNFYFMDLDKANKCNTTPVIEIKKEENLNNIIKNIIDNKSRKNTKILKPK
jgi:nitrogen regulatory protein PII-like uncharacterized protein